MRGGNQSSPQEALFQRGSCSPIEAFPADQPPQTDTEHHRPAGLLSKTHYTVARFVVEPDSQPSSQCTTAAEDLDTETRTEEPPQTAASSKKELNSLQCPLTDKEAVILTRKPPRRSSRIVSRLVIPAGNETVHYSSLLLVFLPPVPSIRTLLLSRCINKTFVLAELQLVLLNPRQTVRSPFTLMGIKNQTVNFMSSRINHSASKSKYSVPLH